MPRVDSEKKWLGTENQLQSWKPADSVNVKLYHSIHEIAATNNENIANTDLWDDTILTPKYTKKYDFMLHLFVV